MSNYQGLDYYNVSDLLSEDEQMIRDTIRDWVSNEVIPRIGRDFDDGVFAKKFIKQMAELGVLGPAFPEKYGGVSASQVAYGLIMQELERGDSGIRSFASVQNALVMFPVFKFGNEIQRNKYLPSLANADLIGCFGLTEPNHGSDPGSMETYAVRDGKDYVLNGSKMWITNGSISDLAVVWAKLDGKIRGFIVEADSPGFSAPEIKRRWSFRTSITSELVFSDCRISQDAILPEAFGLSAPLQCLTQARYGIAWGVVGAAMACYDEVRRYSLERTQFSKPLASFQMIQSKLVEMATEITKAQLLNFRLAQLKQDNNYSHQMISMAKRNNCFQSLRIARMSRDLLGAAGITSEFQSGRHLVNLESVYTYEGTHDIHTLVIGADLTGIEAFN